MVDENAEEKAEKLRIIESKLIAKNEEHKEKLPNFKKFRKAGTSSTTKVISGNILNRVRILTSFKWMDLEFFRKKHLQCKIGLPKLRMSLKNQSNRVTNTLLT